MGLSRSSDLVMIFRSSRRFKRKVNLNLKSLHKESIKLMTQRFSLVDPSTVAAKVANVSIAD